MTWEILQKDLSKYVVLNLEYGDDMVPLIEDMSDKPEECYGKAPKWDTAHKDDYGEQQIFSKKIDLYLKREAAYARNKRKIYTLLYGQCTPNLLSGIKSAEDFTKKDKGKDPIWIMTMIKKLSVGIDETENELCTAFYTFKRFYSGYQKPMESMMIGWIASTKTGIPQSLQEGSNVLYQKSRKRVRNIQGCQRMRLRKRRRQCICFCNRTIFVLEVR